MLKITKITITMLTTFGIVIDIKYHHIIKQKYILMIAKSNIFETNNFLTKQENYFMKIYQKVQMD